MGCWRMTNPFALSNGEASSSARKCIAEDDEKSSYGIGVRMGTDEKTFK